VVVAVRKLEAVGHIAVVNHIEEVVVHHRILKLEVLVVVHILVVDHMPAVMDILVIHRMVIVIHMVIDFPSHMSMDSLASRQFSLQQ